MFSWGQIKGKPLPEKIQVKNQSIIGLFLLLGGNGLIVVGSQWLSPGVVSLLFSTMPLFVAVGQIFFIKDDILNSRGWLGLFMGFFGVGYLVIGGGEALDISLKGAVTVLLGAVLWAIGSILSNIFKRESVVEYDQAIQMTAGGIGLLAVAIFMGEAQNLSISIVGFLAISYLIFFGSLLGYNSYVYLLRVWPPARASTYTYVNPFVAIFLGFLFFKDPLNFHIFFGTGIILLGVFLVQFAGKSKE